MLRSLLTQALQTGTAHYPSTEMVACGTLEQLQELAPMVTEGLETEAMRYALGIGGHRFPNAERSLLELASAIRKATPPQLTISLAA